MRSWGFKLPQCGKKRRKRARKGGGKGGGKEASSR